MGSGGGYAQVMQETRLPIGYRWLGRVGYDEAHALQRRMVDERVQGAGAAPGKKGVSVSISDPVRSMVQGGVSDGVVNMDKVLAVRASIEQGAFKVNPELVADRLLENAQEVLHRGRA